MSKIEMTIGGTSKRSNNGQHPVVIDFDAMTDEVKAFVIRYGLKQYLSDAMAGASDAADAKAKIEARLDKLVSGDLSRTQSGERVIVDSVDGRALKNARAAIRVMAKTKSLKLTKEQVDAAAKVAVEKDPKWKAEAKKQLDAEKKAAEDLGDFDISAFMTTED